MAARRANRKHSKIDSLPEVLRDEVEQLLLAGATYSEIVDFLADKGVGITTSSVCRYAQRFNANVEMLNIAGENFRRMMDEMDKYPSLDTTEAIVRLVSNNLFNTLAGASEDDWQAVSIDKLLRQSNALIRAAAYKKRIDVQNADETAAGFEAVKAMVFEAMAKEQPELYRQVTAFLSAKAKGADNG